MTLLLAALLLAGIASVWVILPILRRRAALPADRVAGGVLDAENEKRVALASLREIEYDYAAGKLDDADYGALREQLSREALRAIRAADGLQPTTEEAIAETNRHACGFRNPAGSRFCSGCGAPLSSVDAGALEPAAV